MLGVYKLDDKTPVLIVAYLAQTLKNHDPGRTEKWMVATATASNSNSLGWDSKFQATPLEQVLFITLLEQNVAYLDVSYKVKQTLSEDGFKTSFILPLGPLSYEDVGRLNTNFGCNVCGKKTKSRCSGCQNESYCSTGTFFPVEDHDTTHLQKIRQNVRSLTG